MSPIKVIEITQNWVKTPNFSQALSRTLGGSNWSAIRK